VLNGQTTGIHARGPATASLTVAVAAVHAVAYCSGAPPMDDVETQLNVAGHLRRRLLASSPGA